MRAKLEDWKNGWHGVELGFLPGEIDVLVERLQMLKAEPDQHFHLTSAYQGGGGLGEITIYLQSESEPSNMDSISSKAFSPGENGPRE